MHDKYVLVGGKSKLEGDACEWHMIDAVSGRTVYTHYPHCAQYYNISWCTEMDAVACVSESGVEVLGIAANAVVHQLAHAATVKCMTIHGCL